MKRLNPYSGLVGGLSAGEFELLSAAVEERRLREEIGVGTLAEAADRSANEARYWRYQRHNARQTLSAIEALREVGKRFPGARLRVAVTGSGARDIARALGAAYIQEVVANSIAVRELYPQVRCAIELGGQDAKMIFFHKAEPDGAL